MKAAFGTVFDASALIFAARGDLRSQLLLELRLLCFGPLGIIAVSSADMSTQMVAIVLWSLPFCFYVGWWMGLDDLVFLAMESERTMQRLRSASRFRGGSYEAST